jgi:hypothetical protein
MSQFTLRDLVWLTVVVALVAAWGVDHFRMMDLMRRQYEAAQAIEDRLNEKGYYIPTH